MIHFLCYVSVGVFLTFKVALKFFLHFYDPPLLEEKFFHLHFISTFNLDTFFSSRSSSLNGHHNLGTDTQRLLKSKVKVLIMILHTSCVVFSISNLRECVQKMIMMFLAWRTDLERGIKSEDHQLETPMRLQKIAVKTSFYYQFPLKRKLQEKSSWNNFAEKELVFDVSFFAVEHKTRDLFVRDFYTLHFPNP